MPLIEKNALHMPRRNILTLLQGSRRMTLLYNPIPRSQTRLSDFRSVRADLSRGESHEEKNALHMPRRNILTLLQGWQRITKKSATRRAISQNHFVSPLIEMPSRGSRSAKQNAPDPIRVLRRMLISPPPSAALGSGVVWHRCAGFADHSWEQSSIRPELRVWLNPRTVSDLKPWCTARCREISLKCYPQGLRSRAPLDEFHWPFGILPLVVFDRSHDTVLHSLQFLRPHLGF
jgi:hypothetical protein